MNGTRKPGFDAGRITMGVGGQKFYLYPIKTTPSFAESIIKNQ